MNNTITISKDNIPQCHKCFEILGDGIQDNILFCDKCNITYCKYCFSSEGYGNLFYGGSEEGYYCLDCDDIY